MKKQIDIVIPFYNAKDYIFEELLRNIHHLILDNKINNFKIILVNDGSTIKNYEYFIPLIKNILDNKFIFVNLKENIGKGGAIKAGIEKSTADYVVFYDIDFPFGIDALYRVASEIMKTENEVVIARRDKSYKTKLPFKRKILSQSVKFILWIASKGQVKESQAGLKAIKKEIIPIILSTQCNSFLMDFEFMIKVTHQKKKINQVLVTPNEHIEFTNFSNKVLFNEIKSLFKILLK